MQWPWLTEPQNATGLIRPVSVAGYPGIAITTKPTSSGPNSQSRMTSAFLGSEHAYAGQTVASHPSTEQSTWYHALVYLPVGTYAPTTGNWNYLLEWHDDEHSERDFGFADSTYMGIITDYPVAARKHGRNPRFMLRLAGGTSAHPTYLTLTAPGIVSLNRPYRMTFHFNWSTDPHRGLAEWFIDGRPVARLHFPTLFRNPDGTASYNTFGIYNYHLNCPWSSTAEFAQVAVGATRGSVGG